jgi:hypothetical protein
MSRSKPPIWRLNRNLAELRWRDCELEVDVYQPAIGLSLQLPGTKSKSQLLGTPHVRVEAQEKLDPYTRAGHLITAYPCTEQRIFGGELSYRVRELGQDELDEDSDTGFDLSNEQTTIESTTSETLTLELVYSIQTDLLDTQPRAIIVSRLNGSTLETFCIAKGKLQLCKPESEVVACLIREGDWSTLVTVMPSDHASFSVQRELTGPGEILFELSWELAADFLEKGVIRRFRACSAVGTDRESLLEAAFAFYHSEIPLTA